MKNSYYLFGLVSVILFCSFTFLKKKKEPLTFKPKLIEKTLGQVSDKLYASKYEVNNLFYKEFLNDLKQSDAPSEYEEARIHDENWNDGKGNKEPLVNTYSSHPAYDDYPVVNISKAGAELFCNWLTEKYNKAEKRKFKKVKFRLPTEEEWKIAARAGHELAPFPWGGYYVRNAKGQFLANFRLIPQTYIKYDNDSQTIEIVPSKFDNALTGARFTAPVQSFTPNDFGLYHMSGNVAEMLQEEGRTKGGSWSSSGYYIQIDAEDEFAGFTKPSPKIGFRYFMEVLEN